jgi:hypothetical protein
MPSSARCRRPPTPHHHRHTPRSVSTHNAGNRPTGRHPPRRSTRTPASRSGYAPRPLPPHRAAELSERIAALEAADTARARWFVATAATRDAAERAKAELGARGIVLDDPDELVTAEEWLAAHHADQTAEDATRLVCDEAELYDPARDTELAALDPAAGDGMVSETAVPDIRDISTRDATEDADPAQRHRIPTAKETAAAIARAQAALAEIQARRETDEARAAEEARRDELTRWAEADRTADEAAQAEHADQAALP